MYLDFEMTTPIPWDNTLGVSYLNYSFLQVYDQKYETFRLLV